VAKPLFHEGKLVGYALCIVHHSDIGGRMADIDSRDIYEEGIQIPPLKFFEAGRENKAIMEFIKTNVRTPHKVEGDLRAQLSALHICERGLQKLLDDYPDETVSGIAERIISRSEQSMRAAIKVLPHGVYKHAVNLPALGQHKVPIPMALTIKIDADGIVLDFTGTSEEVRAAINSPLYYAKGYAYYALKLLLDPHVPNNDGCVRPFEFISPLGTVLNCRRPAPTWGRAMISHYLPEMVFGALRDVLPDRLIADCGSTPLSGIYSRGVKHDGTNFLALQSDRGGYGASSEADGKSCLSFPYNTANIPIEVTENETALVYVRKEMMPDSGGPGRWRGGLGQVVELKVGEGDIAPIGDVLLIPRGSLRGEDSIYPVHGVLGGQNGRGDILELNGKPHAHGYGVNMSSGDRIRLVVPGGGGYGPAHERNPEHVLQDVVEGLVTVEAARADYGVVISRETMTINATATARARSVLGAESGAATRTTVKV
jgi:N-methylhydantoinase B